MSANSKKVSLGTRDIRIAAFNFMQLKEHQDDIALLMKGFDWSDADNRDALVRVLVAATEHAGEPLTADELREALDISNAHDAVLAFFTRNGFGAKSASEQPGEAVAAASAS